MSKTDTIRGIFSMVSAATSLALLVAFGCAAWIALIWRRRNK